MKKAKLLSMPVEQVLARLSDQEKTTNINCTDVVDCINCEDCHRCKKCDGCEGCEDCVNCLDCVDCFGCKALIGKELYFLNVELNQNEYDGMVAKVKAMRAAIKAAKKA